MRFAAIGISGLLACTALAQLPGQATDSTVMQPDGVLAPQVELPPRYRVEFVLFAHNRFDDTEEHFDVVPPESQFAAADEPVAMRFFDEASRQELLDSIEGPISTQPLETPQGIDDELDPSLETAVDPELMLEAYLDPRLVEGPNTRFLDLHELTLFPTFDRLARLDAYTPLVHSGWEQNGLPEADAVAIELAEFDSGNPRGTIRLHMSRYLHISVDLTYMNEPLTAETAALPIAVFTDFNAPPALPDRNFAEFDAYPEPLEPQYFLMEERRILRGELNYFDHPAFGLLLSITLAPEPQSEPEPDVDGPSA